MSENILMFPTKPAETLPPQMAGVYEILASTIEQLRALGHDRISATLDGHLVSIERIAGTDRRR